MKSSEERKLKIIDGINENIIQRNSEKRAALMQFFMLAKRRSRIKRVAYCGAAGLVAASILLVIFIPMLFGATGQRPTYKGMSVSGIGGADIMYDAEGIKETIPKQTLFLEATDGSNDATNTGSDSKSDDMQQSDSEDKDAPLWDPNAIGETYYANPGEDILITVHIDNPDAFEILSFTLNGKKYTAYMFEEGSDLEHLVLKANVGEVEGYKEYTIDAIKYVDGNDQIKSVAMGGEKTITVGVGLGANYPKTTLKNWNAGYDSLTFDYDIHDALGLITEGSPISASLYTVFGEKVASKPITEKSGSIIFSELITNTEYMLIISATYDANDGQGVAEHVLLNNSEIYATKNVFTYAPLNNDTITDDNLYYSLTALDPSFRIDSASISSPEGETSITPSRFTTDHFKGYYEPVIEVQYTKDGRSYTMQMLAPSVIISSEKLDRYYDVSKETVDGSKHTIFMTPTNISDNVFYVPINSRVTDIKRYRSYGSSIVLEIFDENGAYILDDDGQIVTIEIYHLVLRADFQPGYQTTAGEAIGYIMPSSNSSYWNYHKDLYPEDRNLNAIRIETSCDVNLSDIIP